MGQFDAFISYSHAGDGNLAPAVQSGLQRLAKRPFQRRALRVFRDETGLSANPHLWSSIEEALDSSSWFVLLASPEAAESEWVNREVATWIERKSIDACLVVVTDGTLSFGPDQRVDDSTDCLPPVLVDALDGEPRWLDLRWARQEEQLDLRNGRFRSAIADLAAPIHGIAKDELESDDVRQQRTIRRLAVAGVVTVSLLAVGATALAVAAVAQSNRANAEAERSNEEATRANAEATRATARSLAVQAAALTGVDVELSLLLAAEGYQLDPSLDTQAGLLTALEGARLFSDLDPDLPDIKFLEISPDRSTLYVLSKDGQITAHDADSLEQRGDPLLSGIGQGFSMSASLDGSRLAFSGGAGVGVLDLDTGDVVADGLGEAQSVAALNTDGSQIAVRMNSEPTVRVYDVDAAIVIHEIPAEFGFPGFVDDGRLAISELGAPLLKVYDVTGDEAVEAGAYDTGVLGGGLSLSPDRTKLITGGPDGLSVVLDTVSFEAMTPLLRLGTSNATYADFNADGTLVAMAGDDGSVTIFDTSDGTEVTTMAGLTGGLVLKFLSDATLLSASTSDTASAVWTVQGEPAIGSSQPAGLDGVEGMKLLNRGADATLLGSLGTLTIAPAADVRAGTVTRQIGAYGRAFDVSETAGLAAAFVLDVDEADEVVTGRTIEIVRLDDLSSVTTIGMGDRPVTNIALDPTGTRLAVGSDDGDLTVYEAATGRILHGPVRVDQLSGPLGLLVWSADGSRLHTGGQDGVLRTFDTATWDTINETTLVESQQPLRLGTLSSDGSTIVVPAESGEVFLIEERTGQLLGRPLISDGTPIERAVLTDDGRTVAAINSTGKLRLFDVGTGRTIGPTLTGHLGLSLVLELAPTGHLVSGGLFDDLVIEWDLDPETWLKRACALVDRDLTPQEWSDYVGGTYRPTCTNLPTSD